MITAKPHALIVHTYRVPPGSGLCQPPPHLHDTYIKFPNARNVVEVDFLTIFHDNNNNKQTTNKQRKVKFFSFSLLLNNNKLVINLFSVSRYQTVSGPQS